VRLRWSDWQLCSEGEIVAVAGLVAAAGLVDALVLLAEASSGHPHSVAVLVGTFVIVVTLRLRRPAARKPPGDADSGGYGRPLMRRR
jgi:hypothetical protein